MRHRLILNHITHSFEDGGTRHTVLDDVNLQVSEGELVAIMGPSGSGKSTFLSIAGALLKPISGEVLLDGKSLNDKNKQELTDIRLHQIGFVFQSANLIPYLRVEEQLMLIAKLGDMDKRKANERILELLSVLGLQDRRRAYPDKLSGGERQRVAIARALMNDPAILLADEPTASLDAARGMDVVRMLAEEARERGKSAVLVTHDERVLPLCDRVLYLENGSLIDRTVKHSL